jgi:hypothetical protein
MKNRGDPLSGVRSAVFPSKGQPCPSALRFGSRLLHHAVSVFALRLRSPWLRVAPSVSALPLYSRFMRHAVPMFAPTFGSPSLHRAVPVSVQFLSSPLLHSTASGFAPLLRSLLFHLAMPVFAPSLRSRLPYLSKSVIAPILVRISSGTHDPGLGAMHRSCIAVRHNVQDPGVTQVTQLEQPEAFLPGNLRFGITASCLSRRSRG